MTPMEPKFSAEVALAVAGMRRNDANELAKALLAKYMDKISNAPLGMKFQECFNIQRGKPSDKYMELYGKVKKDLSDIGVEFKY